MVEFKELRYGNWPNFQPIDISEDGSAHRIGPVGKIDQTGADSLGPPRMSAAI